MCLSYENKAKTCSLLDAIGRRSCGRSELGIKIDIWENPVVYALTRDWSSLYSTMRSESETAAQSSCSHFECICEHSGCLSSACIVVGAVNFTVMPAENFVSPLSLSPFPLRVSIEKKKSMSPHDSQFIQANVRQSFLVHSSSSGLCVRQIENEQQSTVGEVSQLLEVRGHGAS